MQEKMEIHIETQPKMTMVTARSLLNRPGIAAELFSYLGNSGFNIEMISQSGVSDKLADISFALHEEDAEKAVEHLKNMPNLGAKEFSQLKGMGILTVFGHGLVRIPGIAGRVFSILAKEGVNIEMISTSLSSISVLILEEYLSPSRNILETELEQDA